MKLKFEKEGNSTFAIVEDVEYKGKMCEELIWAEIEQFPDKPGFWVRWEDDYSTAHGHPFYESAVKYIEDNFKSHTPHINGKSYEIKED